MVALLGVVLALPSLGAGWVLDDYMLRAQRSSDPRFEYLSAQPQNLFSFFNGDTERTRAFMDVGIAPWWTLPGLRSAWWRPIASLSHSLDFAMWPNCAVLMHAHNLFWWGLLALAVGYFYRRFMGLSWVAGLAAVLYVIDDARGMPVGFISNRNALFATLFGLLSIMAHDRWRRGNARFGLMMASVWFGLSLLSAEAGIATTAYLFAYAMVLDRASLKERLVSLLPYAVIVFAWRIVWMQLGFGISGNGLYIDPGHDPLRFLAAAAVRAPLLLLGQFGLPPSDLYAALGSTGVLVFASLAIVFLIFMVMVSWRVVRLDKTARFWALGMLLSVVPICATGPSDRLLFFVGLGGSALVAILLAAVFGYGSSPGGGFGSGVGPLVTPWIRRLSVFLVIVHLVIAPIGMALRAMWPMGPRSFFTQVEVRTPFDASIETQDVVIVNAPVAVQACMFPVFRGLEGDPIPRRVHILGPALGPIKIERTDARTLVVSPEIGFFPLPFDQIFREKDMPMYEGQIVQVGDMQAEVLAMGEHGRPIRTKFTFAQTLESSSLRWLQWSQGNYVPFSPPAIGESTTLTATFKIFSQQAQ